MTVENITENEEVLANAENGLVDMMRRKEEEEKKLNEADQAFYNMRNALNEKETELRSKVKEREQLEHLLSDIKDRLTELKLQLAGMKERLNVEFRIDLDEIIDQPRTTETPTEELQEKMRSHEETPREPRRSESHCHRGFPGNEETL